MGIEAIGISKTFGKVKALDNVTLKVPDGQLVALLGPSGCGKTTLLRIIAGIETADRAPETKVLFNGLDMSSKDVRQRKVGFVFQHYALFRHMTIFDNVAFGLEVKPWRSRPSKAQIKAKVEELLGLVQLSGFEKRYPSQLSGGQRQRVALARALAIEPEVLLLDEPFGALDAKVRQDLRRWLRRLHDEIHITSLFVTHDQEEALEVADRVVVMNKGHIEQEGSPDEVFHKPATSFVMNFLGSVNLFHARLEGGKPVPGSFIANPAAGSAPAGGLVRLFARPHEFDIFTAPDPQAIRAHIARMQLAGPSVKLELATPDSSLINVEIPHARFNELKLESGMEVFAKPQALRRFHDDYVI